MTPINNLLETFTTAFNPSSVQFAVAAPTLNGFLQKDSVKVALGWAAIGIAIVMLACIILGIFKVAPVATSFWRRRNPMDEGAESAKNFAIGWAVLIVVPIAILSVTGMVFGKEITDAVTTAIRVTFQ